MEKIILELPKEFWYETKWFIGIMGSLLGVILGFSLNYIRDYLSERKQKKLLSELLFAEIHTNIITLEKDYPELSKTFEEFKPIAESRIFTSHPSFNYIGKEKDLIYKQNIARIVILDEILPKYIMLFYQHLASIKGRAELATKQFRDFYARKETISGNDLIEMFKRHLDEIEVTKYLGYDICAEIAKKYFKANKEYFKITVPIIEKYIKENKEFTLDEASKVLGVKKIELLVILKYGFRGLKIEEMGRGKYKTSEEA